MNEQLEILNIQPGVLFFTQFAPDPEERDYSGQIRFRTTDNARKWLTDNGLDVPNPTDVNWEGEVITNVEKNAKGDTFIEYVNKKRKVSVSWGFLTQVQYDSLLRHLRIDFNSPDQDILYYRIETVNPNSTGRQSINNQTLQRAEFMAYLDGNHAGRVSMYHDEKGKLLIGYKNVRLTFKER